MSERNEPKTEIITRAMLKDMQSDARTIANVSLEVFLDQADVGSLSEDQNRTIIEAAEQLKLLKDRLLAITPEKL